MAAGSPSPDPAPTGAPFGRYTLLRRLAVGGMAEIFLARSTALHGVTRTCVIKRVLPDHSANRQFVSMFIDEARILIGLHHENIVRLYDFGQADGAYFMALEYVKGCDLVAVLERCCTEHQGMNPLAAAHVLRAVCDGLHHAHVQLDPSGKPLGIVHRDVSPHNVLLSWEGDVKIADFGIASARHKLTLTTPGMVLGKFAYMAPEQALGKSVDVRADVFAAGVVLHEALAGERLFAGATPVETIARLLHQEIHPPSRVCAGVPPALDAVVMRALEKDAARRFQTAAEMSQALGAVLDAQGGFGSAHFRAYLESLELERRPKKHRGEKDLLEAAEELTKPIPRPTPPAVRQAQNAAAGWDPELRRLLQSLKQDPNVWTLVAIGARHLALGRPELALSAFRVAAGAFAYRGLLVQAVVALHRARSLEALEAWKGDLAALTQLMKADYAALEAFMGGVDVGGFFAMLLRADPDSWTEESLRHRGRAQVPLYSALPEADLPKLLSVARVKHYAPGEAIVREDDSGDTLYAVGEGRVVVWCRPPSAAAAPGEERVYISSLAEGDFFGEFGFLSGEPRTATVEAVLETWALEIDRAEVESLVRLSPELAGPLLEFYRARVVELLMAKSPLFAALAPDHRKMLLARAHTRHYADNDLILQEGEEGDAFFFIKQGEVEVFSEHDGVPIFINKLREGQFFGEIAVIKRTRRTASVRAMGEVEALLFTRADLEHVMVAQPQVRTLLETAIRDRVTEAVEQLRAATELLR